jgi:hypothetical protein
MASGLPGADARVHQRIQRSPHLDLSNNALHEWPIESQRLSRLMHLDLADNLLTDGSSLQSGLSELPALEQLNLRNNPLSELNVGSLQRLKALDLQYAPATLAGRRRSLPQLSWLDLRDTRISTLPPVVLESSLLNTNLTGAP